MRKASFNVAKKINLSIVILVAYVDNILLTRSDTKGLAETKSCFQTQLALKDLEKPKYFIGIKIVYQKHIISLITTKICSRFI